MTKAVCIANVTIGDIVINYLVEAYLDEIICVKQGIPSAGYAWHEEPVYKRRWAKKPYSSQIVLAERIDSYLSMFDEIEMIE